VLRIFLKLKNIHHYKDPLLINNANIAAIKSIIPEDASNLKNSLNGLVICWIIGTIYLYSGYLSIAKKA